MTFGSRGSDGDHPSRGLSQSVEASSVCAQTHYGETPFVIEGVAAGASSRGSPAAELRLDEPIEVAVEHALGIADLFVGPVVLDHLIGREHV